MLLLKWSTIVWSKRSRYFVGTIQQITLTFSITSSFFKNYFGWSGVYFIFILHLYITVTFRHTIVFYGKDCFSNIKTSSKRLEYLNIYYRHHNFYVKTCFQQNRYVFDVIVTSWVLFVFCISWNFARDISTVCFNVHKLYLK
jgi:hypothetical protein